MQKPSSLQQLTTLAMGTTTMPVEIAAIWGAFLHEGLMDSMSCKRDKALLLQWNKGCIELMTEACAFLPAVWEEIGDEWESCTSYSGVFEYEVISVLGHYLGDYIILRNGLLPSFQEVQAIIKALVYCFLEDVSVHT